MVFAAVLVVVVAALSGSGSSQAGGAAFGPPVKVTPDLGFGYEPSLVVDRYGNIFATAH